MGWELADVEQPFIAQLQTLGWQHAEGSLDDPAATGRSGFAEVMQSDLLRQQLYAPDAKRFDKIALPYAHGYTFVELADVMYCESDSSYSKFFLVTGEMYLITKTLGDVEDMLSGGDFFRIHKQFLVNMRHIRSYIRGDGGYVVMPNKVSIPVSRIKKDEFTERFTRF